MTEEPAYLVPLQTSLRDAVVVGLGRSSHGTQELSLLTAQIVRLLVEDLGFRALAVELDPTTGIRAMQSIASA